VINSGETHNVLNVNIRDKNDEEVLISAVQANVDLFITGDKDFNDINLSKPVILTPTEFLDKY
jgi:predicted nucleic acid-binding protein